MSAAPPGSNKVEEGDDALAPGERLPIAVGDLAIASAQSSAGTNTPSKYRIDKILGMGRTAIVAAATRADDRGVRVALKVMRTPLSAPKTIATFQAEGRAAIPLKTQHVAKVLDVGVLESSGLPYIAMELLEGNDLATTLERQGVIRPYVAIDYIVQACDAISEAHRHRLIHRDLRPKNLFLTQGEDGAPIIKVLDFGTSKITHDIVVKRWPMYMAPEQIRSAGSSSADDVDGRADVWALGAILFELITGHRAFGADSVAEIVAKISDRPAPSLEIYLPSAPSGLAAVIHRCLEKDRKKRYATAGALAMALSDLGAKPSSSAVPAWDRQIDLNVDSLVAVPSSPSSPDSVVPKPPPGAIPRGAILSATFVLPGRRARSRLAPAIFLAAIAIAGVAMGSALIVRQRARAAAALPMPVPTTTATKTSPPATHASSAAVTAVEPSAASSSSAESTAKPAASPRHWRTRPRSKGGRE